VYGIWTVSLMPVQLAAVLVGSRLANRLPRFYHRVCCRILGIRVIQQGAPSGDHPVLFVSNHTSYLDITILGSVIAGSFVSKAEVADWPFFGWLAKLQRTVFIDRRGSRADHHRDDIGARLEKGDDLILFPEGTSSDGNRILPFKTALFSVAERRVQDRAITVQPVSVAYTRIDGLPIGREWRPLFAWYGGMDMGSHICNVISLGKLTVEVAFHPPLDMAAIGREAAPRTFRRLVADRCYAAVVDGHARALFATGRRASAQAAAPPAAAPPSASPAGTPLGSESA
jgi:1-acyl-sn-glycerol-3-phosphate acyltransferase